MKYFILIVLVAFTCSSCSQVRKTDLAILDLKGNVSSINELHYKFVYDGKVISKEKKYDWGVNEIQKLSYQANFNKSGFYNLLINHYDSIRIDTVIYKYNDKGFLEYLFSYDTTQIKCNKYGNVEETILKDGSVSISKYNSEGNLTNSKFVFDGKVQSERRRKYKKGLLIEDCYYGAAGAMVSMEKLEHNVSKHKLTTTYYSSAKEVISIGLAENDTINNPVLVVYKDNSNNEYARETFKYEYDEHGNWIIRMSFVNGKAALLTERVIEYYE
ncbi:hypothetical protein [Saccharicrinis aurantiacus]|uniref:hypothetical protein n=1 Tax=Saccharicrinis aurantiacus TaxID=1849719 RepID=UPI0024914FB2|nr:hypothetical protein [Saccharicrinis aurantiacus]